MPKLEQRTIPVELRVFAKSIKTVRQNIHLKQNEAAQRAGLTLQYLSEVERLIASVSIDSMAKISQALEVPLYRMFDPSLEKTYDFENNPEWHQYQAFIDNSEGIPYERKVFAENLQAARVAQGYNKKIVEELTGLSKGSIISIERANSSTSLEKALLFSKFYMIPFHNLVKPSHL